jgi:hypothetical protein
VEYPVLSLYTDGRENWLYLWGDRTALRTRWFLFTVSRELLVAYLKQGESLRTLIEKARRLWTLELLHSATLTRSGRKAKPRRYLWTTDLGKIKSYMPSEDSHFDGDLTADLDLSKELVPDKFNLSIEGIWFGVDFQYLFRRYERLYAFFYATRPRFVRPIDVTLRRLLRAPWTGGFSRVNLYSQLATQIPGIHALKVEKINYASPGEVRFEAIASIGESIREATTALLANQEEINIHVKKIRKIITAGKLAKVDLSNLSDKDIQLEATALTDFENGCAAIAKCLGLRQELKTLRTHSPNFIVYGKAVLSLVRQIDKLAELHRLGMLSTSAK